MKILKLKSIKVLFLIILFYFLFKYKIIDIISIAYCEDNTLNNKSNCLSVSDILPPGMLFTGCLMVLKSFPPQFRVATKAAIVTTSTFFSLNKRASDNAVKNSTFNSAVNSGSNSGFKASSIIEHDFTIYLQSQYFICLICFFLLILAFLVFTVIVLWVIVHKYNSWVFFLTRKTQNKLVFTCIEKIKKISSVKIIYFVFFFLYRFIFMYIFAFNLF